MSYWKKQIGKDRILHDEIRKAEREIRNQYKGNGRQIKEEIEKLRKSGKYLIPASRFLELPSDISGYLEDMFFAQAWAEYNRSLIVSRIAKACGFGKELDRIESVHNFLDPGDRVIRKGAIQASLGQKVVIPMNMSWGVVIAEGLGNPEWNYSAPHGAGRKLSRGKAKEQLTMSDFAESMGSVFSTSVCPSCLDEAPGAYKDPESILDLIGDTVVILDRIKPLLSIKDGEN